ncbi:DUF2799 domain-containing protein [Photobacterium gaetbulicola]|uniref:Lipoprotein n=1 Tax=Photobacterium gaetbulicola Gung47 TaxID=658445 RepID=A0A0C5WD79_9GAMM|nr:MULTISPECIES: DUF2799 domain-containing protein [Photobacterium]AJR05043.1 hypothetical protein H744_1c0010 [Photobacterium gaetbulicola Gung47]PSU06926.1 DUF2799 domain-containing protein [Photobacterium gaetbulicola]WEM44782.1 DUF2799 domain-containing protein [Photobacterium sp. DA100]
MHNKNLIRALAGPFMVLALSACSTNYVDSYVAANDWQSLGEQDALKGHRVRDLSSLANGDLLAAQQKYSVGYEMGRAEYCDVDKAWQLGKSGQNYFGICDGLPHGNEFRQQYQYGHDAFVIEMERESSANGFGFGY